MDVKFYQVIDNVHGTIYYTNLEKKVINTPFFNRLHDVNQSSTVYLTFPPNRTKRYEHSLGTMQLTSDIFYNASANSIGCDALNLLLENADKEFKKVISYIKQGRGNGKFIFSFEQKTLGTMDSVKRKQVSEITKIINDEFANIFEGNCLLNLVPRCYKNGYDTFLFMCLLQSLRLVGLLHDIGHPPQSHIIEKVLGEIYDEVQSKSEEERTLRQNTFVDILSSYQNIEDDSIKQIDERMAIKTENKKLEHLHEMVGVQIIKYIVEWVIPNMLEKCISTGKAAKDILYTLYYLTIIEFVFAIVRNKNAFWSGLHSIIDGTIDTDRLDFVPRDSGNSGMVWGSVEYKRLINTVKLGIVSDKMGGRRICVCFSHKNIPQMDELLHNRYRIFTMINYHHRSTKIASLYQKAVKLLALDYLESTEADSDEKMYFSNISGLWRTLEIVYAKKSSVLNLIQWNDSWLNGLLYKHLVEEYSNSSDNTGMNKCHDYLREIYLNDQMHISLVKRKTELLEINDTVQEALENLIEKMENELIEVQKEINDGEKEIQKNEENHLETDPDIIAKLDKKKEAYDFLAEMYKAFGVMDWAMIEMHLGNELVPEAIHSVLDRHSENISSYIVEKVKFSLGVGEAYVYDYGGCIIPYEDCSDIKERLENARLSFPYYYIYLKWNENKWDSFHDNYLSVLRTEIGQKIGEELARVVESQINFEAGKEN